VGAYLVARMVSLLPDHSGNIHCLTYLLILSSASPPPGRWGQDLELSATFSAVAVSLCFSAVLPTLL
jgi:hypothetical protein